MKANKKKFKITEKLDFSSISVRGSDATNFLQSQFTNNINELGKNSLSHQLNGYCSPKGRLIAVIRVLFLRKNEFILLIPKELSNLFLKRFKMFILRSNVEIEDVSKKEHIFGFWGDIDTCECRVGESINFDNLTLFKTSNCNKLGPRFWIKSNIQNLHEEMIKLPIFANETLEIESVSSQMWLMSEMLCGIPWIFINSTEKFTPQSVNLDLVDGVSFNKGCYPGQEVVARMHFLGKNKKRVFLAEMPDVNFLINSKVFEDNNLIYLLNEKKIKPSERYTEIGQIIMFNKVIGNNDAKAESFVFLIQVQIISFLKQQPKLAIKINNKFSVLKLIPLPYEKEIIKEIDTI